MSLKRWFLLMMIMFGLCIYGACKYWEKTLTPEPEVTYQEPDRGFYEDQEGRVRALDEGRGCDIRGTITGGVADRTYRGEEYTTPTWDFTARISCDGVDTPVEGSLQDVLEYLEQKKLGEDPVGGDAGRDP